MIFVRYDVVAERRLWLLVRDCHMRKREKKVKVVHFVGKSPIVLESPTNRLLARICWTV